MTLPSSFMTARPAQQVLLESRPTLGAPARLGALGRRVLLLQGQRVSEGQQALEESRAYVGKKDSLGQPAVGAYAATLAFLDPPVLVASWASEAQQVHEANRALLGVRDGLGGLGAQGARATRAARGAQVHGVCLGCAGKRVPSAKRVKLGLQGLLVRQV